MTMGTDPPIETLIMNVLHHFGISKAHVAARDMRDWQELTTSHADQLASLTLFAQLPSCRRHWNRWRNDP